MKIVRFIHAGTQSYGVVTEGGVVDAGARLRPKFGDVTDVLTAGALGELEALTDASADFALADIRYLPPVKGANSVLAVGRNYGSAYADMGTNFPGHPSIFMRRHGSHAGHLEPLIRPKASQFFDGEAELAVIIGTGGRHIPEDTAMDHIAFYSILNDGTLTDWADHTSRNVSPGKNFDSCGAFGPWMVSRDEIADAHALTILHRINGEEIQNGSTGDMIFSIAQILHLYCFGAGRRHHHRLARWHPPAPGGRNLLKARRPSRDGNLGDRRARQSGAGRGLKPFPLPQNANGASIGATKD